MTHLVVWHFICQSLILMKFSTVKMDISMVISLIKITDLKDDYITSTITQDDLTKVSRQLNVSMGKMFYLVEGFAMVMFIMLIYLLTKMIIENNKVSISMVKILGYTSKEIQKCMFMLQRLLF